MRCQYKILSNLILLLVIICLVPACRHQNQAPAPAAAPLTKTISSGPIELTMIADPERVHLDHDILLTLRVFAPSNMDVRLPPLGNRLKGFVLNGIFTRDAVDTKNRPVKEYCSRLTPTLSEEYRIAPMAVTWINNGQTPPSKGWFATCPLLFQTAGISKGLPSATIHDITGPVWIYPAFKTVALWVLAIICAVGAFYLLWRLGRRIHKTIQLRRMSPRERAIYELSELMAQNLIAKQKIKQFYLELTMIVRRYIERAHAVRAPEETTEEFLVAITHNPAFKDEVVRKLCVFLQTADLVKFAAYQPEQEIIDKTITTARDYIDTDEMIKQETKEP